MLMFGIYIHFLSYHMWKDDELWIMNDDYDRVHFILKLTVHLEHVCKRIRNSIFESYATASTKSFLN